MVLPIVAAGSIGSTAVILIIGGIIVVLFLTLTSQMEGLAYMAAILAAIYLLFI